MLRVTGRAAFDCECWTRRNFVQAGVLGLGGWTLSQSFAALSPAAERRPVQVAAEYGGPKRRRMGNRLTNSGHIGEPPR